MLIGDVWISSRNVLALAARLGVHRTTVSRWIERKELPAAVYQLLLITEKGDLGAMHDAWAGWSIDPRRGDLVTPVGECVQPGHVIAYPYHAHLLSTLRHDRVDLVARIKRLESEITALREYDGGGDAYGGANDCDFVETVTMASTEFRREL